ncbi:MAG: alpha-amylase family glycosyl hydrolase [Acidimicrobiia bacterium]|jgi:alpha-glucosidase
MSRPGPGGEQPPWWVGAAGYEVYLRSFADGDGDGVGDLRGLRDRLAHLAWLGVDFVWITPFYPSPMADHGYDITDHTDVDPRYGTLADIDAVIDEAHRLGLRVVIDLVPNHTSDQHPWFRASRSDPTGPFGDWYHWHPGRGGDEAPNNWRSYFGGSAWSRDPERGAWYCHLFLPQQPDLNWATPAVADAFDEILRFWLRRGVDGFRVDVAQGLAKDPAYRDNPPAAMPTPGPGPRAEWGGQEHRYDIAQPGALAVFRRWHEGVADSGALLLGEVYLPEPAEVAPYVAGDGLDVAFSFAFASLRWDAEEVRQALRSTLIHLGERACWTQTSHDEPRPPTRFGGGARGQARARAVTTLLAGMPGLFVLYQGEELGLEDATVPAERAQDPLGDRDGCRTPLPWSNDPPGWGFTTASDSWLPVGDRQAGDTVAAQRGNPRSALHLHRRLLEVRRRIRPDAPVRWVGAGPVVAYARGDHQVAAAIDDAPLTHDPGPGTWRVVLSTDPDRELGPTGPLTLAPAEAVVLERSAAEGG